MGLPGPSKPARFEPLEWPIEVDKPDEPEREETPVEEPAKAPEKEPVPA